MNQKAAVKWWAHAPREWIRYFILSGGAILLAGALARFFATFGQAQILALPDPVLGIPLRLAVLFVGTFELVVALICLFGKRLELQVGLLAWLAVNLLVFQIGAYAMHCQWQTTGIGSLTDPLQLTCGLTGIVIGFIPLYLLAGSGTASFWLWFDKRRENRLKSARLGHQIDCPKYHKSIALRLQENLKMACYFCNEHIAFPSYAVRENYDAPL
jgi:hypothetical protein